MRLSQYIAQLAESGPEVVEALWHESGVEVRAGRPLGADAVTVRARQAQTRHLLALARQKPTG